MVRHRSGHEPAVSARLEGNRKIPLSFEPVEERKVCADHFPIRDPQTGKRIPEASGHQSGCRHGIAEHFNRSSACEKRDGTDFSAEECAK